MVKTYVVPDETPCLQTPEPLLPIEAQAANPPGQPLNPNGISAQGEGLGQGSGNGQGTGRGKGSCFFTGNYGLGNLGTVDDKGQLRVDFSALKVLHQEIPDYPIAAKCAGISGEVIVKLSIDEHGIPAESSIIIPNHPTLEHAALQAAKRWRFQPVIHEGKAVRAVFSIQFIFTLLK